MKKLSDLTDRLLQDIRKFNLPDLALGNDIVHPIYNGKSILNIPSTICHEFGIPGLGAKPFDRDLLSYIDKVVSDDGIQNVILILMDGLSLNRLRKWIDEGHLPVWKELSEEGVLFPLTSIVPSTTSAALSSIWTGRSPAEHGIIGYEMWMKEYGIVINTVVQGPMSYKSDKGSLVKAGFKPEDFIQFPTLGTHLRKHDIQPYAFQHYSISRSGLSKMLFKDVDVHPFTTMTDLWINLMQLIEDKPDERMFTWVYWGELDYFSHHYGPDDKRVLMEFINFSNALQNNFVKSMRQKGQGRGKTLLLLTADHGELVTHNNPRFELRHHPELIKRLHIMPTGEHRLAYLFVRPGEEANVRRSFEQTWPGDFSVIDSHKVIKSGLLGSGELHPQLFDRVGELVVIANGDAYLWWADKGNHLYGRHGGMSADEMVVPFLAVRL